MFFVVVFFCCFFVVCFFCVFFFFFFFSVWCYLDLFSSFILFDDNSPSHGFQTDDKSKNSRVNKIIETAGFSWNSWCLGRVASSL